MGVGEKMDKQTIKKVKIGVIAICALIWILTMLLYKSKFWPGLAGVAMIPFVFIAFIADAWENEISS